MTIGIVVLAAMLFAFGIAGLLVFLYLRYQNRLTQEKVQQQQNEINYQKQLIQVTVISQEAERKRIGQDLHDQVGTALSRLGLIAENPSDHQANQQSLNQIIDTVIKDVRAISHQLSPTILSLMGLEEALYEITTQIHASGKLQIHLENHASDILSQQKEAVNVALYRIIQELIANTIKHAHAKNIHISFETTPSHLVVHYKDDGVGLTDSSFTDGMGMKNIAGRLLSIDGNYELGTQNPGFSIQLHIPLHGNRTDSY